MKVLVDTSVWSLGLRKKTLAKNEIHVVEELKELIKELRVVMIGPIRQELLSGISAVNKYELLKERLSGFEDEIVTTAMYERAAELSNLCRRNGIQGSHTDFFICSVALSNSFSIFSTDKDFIEYSKCFDLQMHEVRKSILEK